MGCGIFSKESYEVNDDYRDLELEFGPSIYPEVLKSMFITEGSTMYPEVFHSLSMIWAMDDKKGPMSKVYLY